MLTGDTVLGRGTTVVAHPDGRLGDYLDSLRRLRSLTVDDGVHTVLPGHGPVLDDAQGAVEYYLAHRAHRLAQVETAVENGTARRRRWWRRSTRTWTDAVAAAELSSAWRSWSTWSAAREHPHDCTRV